MSEPEELSTPGVPAALVRLLDRAGVPVARIDTDGVLRSTNPAFALACGRPGSELVDTHLIAVALADDHPVVVGALTRLVTGQGEVVEAEVRVVGADGRVRPLLLVFATMPEPASADEPAPVFCVARDLSSERRRDRAERKERLAAAQASTVDPSTGLPNRRGLELMLASAARRAGRDRSCFAALQCDLDLGDAAAEEVDDLVQACSERVRQRLREADTVTRPEPTTLVVVAEDLHDDQDAAGVAYRLLSTLVEPLPAAHAAADAAMVIGIAVADEHTPPHSLLAAAAQAAAEAREDGPGNFRIIDLRGIAGSQA